MAQLHEKTHHVAALRRRHCEGQPVGHQGANFLLGQDVARCDVDLGIGGRIEQFQLLKTLLPLVAANNTSVGSGDGPSRVFGLYLPARPKHRFGELIGRLRPADLGQRGANRAAVFSNLMAGKAGVLRGGKYLGASMCVAVFFRVRRQRGSLL